MCQERHRRKATSVGAAADEGSEVGDEPEVQAGPVRLQKPVPSLKEGVAEGLDFVHTDRKKPSSNTEGPSQAVTGMELAGHLCHLHPPVTMPCCG